METPNEPIDLPPRNSDPRRDPLFWMRLVGTALLVVGLLFRIQGWPMGSTILLAGLVVWSLWNVLFLFSVNGLRPWEVLYTVGRLLLALALFLQLYLMSYVSLYVFGAAALVFLGGVVASYFDKQS